MLLTDRLKISKLSYNDCEFILRLVNETSFKHHIGDRGVRTLDDAREYLRNGAIRSYAINGFGLLLVRRRDDATPIGICGLVKRESLACPDLGFAFLEAHRSNGYAYESSLAVIEHAQNALNLTQIVAIAGGDNEISQNLLEKLGFRFEQMVRMPDEKEDICQYARNL